MPEMNEAEMIARITEIEESDPECAKSGSGAEEKLQKAEEALRLIFSKRVDVSAFLISDSVESYNSASERGTELTEEEFALLEGCAADFEL